MPLVCKCVARHWQSPVQERHWTAHLLETQALKYGRNQQGLLNVHLAEPWEPQPHVRHWWIRSLLTCRKGPRVWAGTYEREGERERERLAWRHPLSATRGCCWMRANHKPAWQHMQRQDAEIWAALLTTRHHLHLFWCCCTSHPTSWRHKQRIRSM